MIYFLRLFTLLTALSVSLAFIWYGLRSYGESQPVSTYQTELVKELMSQQSHLIWKSLPADHPTLLMETQYESGTWKVLSHPESTTPLEKALSRLQPKQKVLLFFDIQSPTALPSLRNTIHKSQLGRSIIFCSRSDGILKDLRELEPTWSYCSGEIFMTRMLGLSSLGLASLSAISADVFFIHLNEIKLQPAILKLIEEGHRQNRLVLIGPVEEPHTNYPADGWVLMKP